MPAAEPRQRRNQERRANIARRSSRLLAQSLRSEDFTRMISEKQKTLTAAAKPQGSQPITPEHQYGVYWKHFRLQSDHRICFFPRFRAYTSNSPFEPVS